MKKKFKQSDEKPRWLDDPSNVRRFLYGFFLLCGICIVADFVFSFGWHKHHAFSDESIAAKIEAMPAFYGFYGFVSCTLLILISKVMRGFGKIKILMRDEDYWEK